MNAWDTSSIMWLDHFSSSCIDRSWLPLRNEASPGRSSTCRSQDCLTVILRLILCALMMDRARHRILR